MDFGIADGKRGARRCPPPCSRATIGHPQHRKPPEEMAGVPPGPDPPSRRDVQERAAPRALPDRSHGHKSGHPAHQWRMARCLSARHGPRTPPRFCRLPGSGRADPGHADPGRAHGHRADPGRAGPAGADHRCPRPHRAGLCRPAPGVDGVPPELSVDEASTEQDPPQQDRGEAPAASRSAAAVTAARAVRNRRRLRPVARRSGARDAHPHAQAGSRPHGGRGPGPGGGRGGRPRGWRHRRARGRHRPRGPSAHAPLRLHAPGYRWHLVRHRVPRSPVPST
ncbi:hypothetical protein QJS66_09110 [Kocuria rhizophila]|nr:hypothetical protein QJS66_09110 [Kocuria rhizophila]